MVAPGRRRLHGGDVEGLARRLAFVALLCLSYFAHGGETASECGLYLAASSIPNAGFGVFSGKNYTLGERVGYPGLGIQVTDPDIMFQKRELITEFGWNSMSVGGESEANSVFTLLPGVGMLVNFRKSRLNPKDPVLSNIIPGGLAEDPLVEKRNPAAGSFSSYHNFSFIATDRIDAGQEIFASVGEHWYTDHFTDDAYPVMPIKEDHVRADRFLRDIVTFWDTNDALTEATLLDVLYRMKNEVIKGSDGVRRLIPDSLEELSDCVQRGTAKATLNHRGERWLRENGKCLDNIGPGTSKVAGRGAFATRFIKKGSLVAPAPLVHIMDRVVLGNASAASDLETSAEQLLVNYCFGHRKSSMLLCPTTNVALINHSSDAPNAKIEWAESTANVNRTSNSYHFGSLDDIKIKSFTASETNSKLMFDFIAIRDIHEGEEILIDYGEEWEEAWEQHVNEWAQPKWKQSPPSAAEMNSRKRPIIPTSAGQNHSYLCRLEPFAKDVVPDVITMEDYYANPLVNYSSWNEETRLMFLDNDYLWWWPCDVLSCDRDSSMFTVNVLQRVSTTSRKPMIRNIKNVPRESIRFVDKPYHSNQHVANAFRHPIQIPDDIFPLRWRQDYVPAQSLHLGKKDIGSDKAHEDMLKTHKENLERAKCGLYLAPSTIPNAGNGVFVGIDFPSANIPVGPFVPSIPVADVVADRWDAFDYTWEATSINAEYEGDSVHVLAVNEGCLGNFHPGLVNAKMGDANYNPVLDRHFDPGAGAFSDYTSHFEAMHALKAGEEIFISYGESWFDGRENLGVVPLSANYLDANKVVSSLASLAMGPNGGLSTSQLSGLFRIVKEDLLADEKTSAVFATAEASTSIYDIVARNGTAESTTERRSQEWLEKNGQCLDHVYTQPSTVPGIGIGAFARRLISKDTIIISAPLLASYGRGVFDVRSDDNINVQHLLLNYQFGHPDSSVLFFPVNTAVAINHQSERQNTKFNPYSPNAKLRWSSSNKKSTYYQQRHLEDLKRELYATMTLEFVATRDVHVGEEIFIDYGVEWENAWDDHVRNFKPPCPIGGKDDNHACLFKSSKFVSEMNKDIFNTTYHEWSEEHFTLCHSDRLPQGLRSAIVLSDNSASFRDILHEDDGFELALERGDTSWIPCKILRADLEDKVFDVVYFSDEIHPEIEDANILKRVQDLGRAEIKFANKPYKSDQHWPGAFRHEIKIPDSIFPSLWKDLVK